MLPWVVGFREDCLLRFVCFLNGDHRLLGQNVYKVTKTTSGSGPVPGRQQVLRGASQWVERPPALWVGLSPAWLHILPLSYLHPLPQDCAPSPWSLYGSLAQMALCPLVPIPWLRWVLQGRAQGSLSLEPADRPLLQGAAHSIL